MLALSNRRSVGHSFDVWILAVPHILSMDVIAFPYAQIVENYIDGWYHNPNRDLARILICCCLTGWRKNGWLPECRSNQLPG